ncbi:MAG: hypothetical protein R8K48_07605 [Gallionella sp.]
MSDLKPVKLRSFWLILISGMVTGMGNGSVFGATLMCLMGRGGFSNWGGINGAAYDPSTFTGFIDWAMFLFGFLFCLIMIVALGRHEKIQQVAA